MGGGNPLPVSPKTYVIDVVRVVPLSITDENGHTTSYTYDNNTTVNNFLTGRIKTATLDGAGSNYTTYNYDTRSNITSMVVTPKSGSTLPTLATSATYPADPCANPATCNKPITTTDSAGQVTNYYYNTNGTLNYVQLPAPSSGAARPEVHYTYASGQAQVVSSSGAVGPQGDVVSLPTGTIACTVGAYSSCTSASLITNQIAYPGGSTPTSLLAQATSVQSGDGKVNSTTTVAYDMVGNVISQTDPVGNVSTVTYAADRQPLLAVGPSVDGSSTSARSAVQYQYSLDGLPATVTTGSYNPSTQVLTPAIVTTTSFDPQDRPVTQSLSDGTTTYALTQYSYNGVGRPDCVAVRMNPATFASPPTSACTLGTQGSDGPDRIMEYWYDQANNVIAINSALGVTGTTRLEPQYSYTNHNLPQSMLDGNGNATLFVYDGFDRLTRTCYQSTVNACQAGTATDYVALTYDSAGRLSTRSLRGTPTSVTTYGYDNLGRVTNITYPGNGAFDQAVSTTYDNLNRVLSATDASGDTVAYTYDALGDVLTEADANSARTMAYDAAGRRTQLTWGDGRYVTYQYNGTSALSAVLENGVTPLVAYAYDALGRRASLTRGNGVVTSYTGYTPQGATAMAITLPTATNNLTLAFAYNAAGQIKSRTATSANQAWFYQGYYNVSRSYTPNVLNQYVASGSVMPTYDAKGNLTSAGDAAIYGYSTKNELITRSDTGSTFYHDPLGRLDTITTSPTSTRLQYNGADLATEVDGGSGTVLRRYVHGTGADEALVWYEGSDFSDRRYLVVDERGSVIAVTDAGGNPLAFNTYDEYGIPGSDNQGRFEYTGQAWVPELGMYSYKARLYSPTMGRFLQTDPAGYPNGPNWYAYAGNDPINGLDPTGTSCVGGDDNGPGFCSNDPSDFVYTSNGGPLNSTDAACVSDPGICVLSGITQASSYNSGASNNSYNPFSSVGIVPDVSSLVFYGNMAVDNIGLNLGNIYKSVVSPQSKACSGPVVSLSLGVSGTFAIMAGGNAGANVSLNIPTNINWSNPLQGLQLVFSAQAGGLLGAGAYAGGGVTRGAGYSATHATQGWSTSSGLQAEGDFGWAAGSVGGSVQGNASSASGAIGTKVGNGVGLYAGAGAYGSGQYATPSLFCH